MAGAGAGQWISTILGAVGGIVNALGQNADQQRQQAAGTLAQSQGNSQLIQAPGVGGNQVQAPTVIQSAPSEYAAALASRPGWATRIGSYMGSGGDMGNILSQNISEKNQMSSMPAAQGNNLVSGLQAQSQGMAPGSNVGNAALGGGTAGVQAGRIAGSQQPGEQVSDVHTYLQSIGGSYGQ